MSSIPPVPPKSIPFAAARAYGVRPSAAPAFPGIDGTAAPTRAATPATGRPAAPSGSTAPVPGRDRIEAPHASPEGAARLDRLVAGRVRSDVNRGLDFDEDGPRRPGGPTAPILPLYTRSADRVEAATAIGVGRRIDVAG